MKIVNSKKEFLKVPQRFISLLTENLAKTECKIPHAQDDLDILVVETAVNDAETLSNNMIGNETDLLVLLLNSLNLDACDIFM